MLFPVRRTPSLAAALLLSSTVLVGCHAERAVVQPVEPTWSYQDGESQLSNNDAWEQMIPSTALVFDESQVASVEESTED